MILIDSYHSAIGKIMMMYDDKVVFWLLTQVTNKETRNL